LSVCGQVRSEHRLYIFLSQFPVVVYVFNDFFRNFDFGVLVVPFLEVLLFLKDWHDRLFFLFFFCASFFVFLFFLAILIFYSVFFFLLCFLSSLDFIFVFVFKELSSIFNISFSFSGSFFCLLNPCFSFLLKSSNSQHPFNDVFFSGLESERDPFEKFTKKN